MKPPFYKIPSPTPEDPFPQKDADGACALSILLGEGVARTGLLGGRGV